MNIRYLLAVVLMGVAVTATAKASYYLLKAEVAQLLLTSAWEKTLVNQSATYKPWPWADIVPVAMLNIDTLNEKQVVLSGHSGEALSFGPGMIETNGGYFLAGHRDSHFKFLEKISMDEIITLNTADGNQKKFRVAATQIINSQTQSEVSIQSGTLVLSTCYPFDAITAGGPLRYFVTAYQL